MLRLHLEFTSCLKSVLCSWIKKFEFNVCVCLSGSVRRPHLCVCRWTRYREERRRWRERITDWGRRETDRRRETDSWRQKHRNGTLFYFLNLNVWNCVNKITLSKLIRCYLNKKQLYSAVNSSKLFIVKPVVSLLYVYFSSVFPESVCFWC